MPNSEEIHSLAEIVVKLTENITEQNNASRELVKVIWRIHRISISLVVGVATVIMVVMVALTMWIKSEIGATKSRVDYRADGIEQRMIHQEVHVERAPTHEEVIERIMDKKRRDQQNKGDK
jgi:hypothetical protein